MSTLDPLLKLLAEQDREGLSRLARPNTFALTDEAEAAPRVKVILEFSGDLSALEEADFAVDSVVGTIATGSVEVGRLQELSGAQGVARIEASLPVKLELDVSLLDVNAIPVHTGPPGRRGAGVIVGIIDSGIDYTHGGFLRPDGSSRILALWDQQLTPSASEAAPAGFTYGVEYSKASIDAAIAAPDPFQLVRHRDLAATRFHGTHVAGIAAGDGSTPGQAMPAGTFVGVAPEADIVFVATNFQTAGILDAARYIFDFASARGKPAVVNLSLGSTIGPHDGTSTFERGLDAHLGTAQGRTVVVSAGNEQNDDSHASGFVAVGATENVRVQVPAGLGLAFLDIWYEGTDRFDASVTTPGGAISAVVTPGNSISAALASGDQIFVDSVLNDPGNADNRIFIALQSAPGSTVTAGTWQINLSGTAVTSGRFDVWSRTDSPSSAAAFLQPHRDLTGTVTPPATALEVISVGSHITKGAGATGISAFSSTGPTRDGRQCPHLTAPGQIIVSARPMNQPDPYQPLAGTSMAAPHVTGAVALMLQSNGSMTAAQIRDCLTRSARTDIFTGQAPNLIWGSGKLNVAGAVACAGPAIPPKTLRPPCTILPPCPGRTLRPPCTFLPPCGRPTVRPPCTFRPPCGRPTLRPPCTFLPPCGPMTFRPPCPDTIRPPCRQPLTIDPAVCPTPLTIDPSGCPVPVTMDPAGCPSPPTIDPSSCPGPRTLEPPCGGPVSLGPGCGPESLVCGGPGPGPTPFEQTQSGGWGGYEGSVYGDWRPHADWGDFDEWSGGWAPYSAPWYW